MQYRGVSLRTLSLLIFQTSLIQFFSFSYSPRRAYTPAKFMIATLQYQGVSLPHFLAYFQTLSHTFSLPFHTPKANIHSGQVMIATCISGCSSPNTSSLLFPGLLSYKFTLPFHIPKANITLRQVYDSYLQYQGVPLPIPSSSYFQTSLIRSLPFHTPPSEHTLPPSYDSYLQYQGVSLLTHTLSYFQDFSHTVSLPFLYSPRANIHYPKFIIITGCSIGFFSPNTFFALFPKLLSYSF